MIRQETQGSYSAQAKLLLFGEHSVLYGYSAIGIALPWTIRLCAGNAIEDAKYGTATVERGKFEREALEEEKPEKQKLEKEFCAVLAYAEETFAISSLKDLRCTIESNIPIGMGFGSSAALCSCLSQYIYNIYTHEKRSTAFQKKLNLLLSQLFDYPLKVSEKHKIWALAHTLEEYFHGRASGIDTALSVFGGTLGFYPQTDMLPRIQCLQNIELCLIVGYVPRSSNARESIQTLRTKVDLQDSQTLGCLRTLGEATSKAISILEGESANAQLTVKRENHKTPQTTAEKKPATRKTRLQLLAHEVQRAQECLDTLGLVSAQIRAILKKATAYKALGGKMSGAGCGGAFYIVCEDADSAHAINKKLLTWYASEGINARSEVKLIQGI